MFLLIGYTFCDCPASWLYTTKEPITPESEGFWNQYIVYPLAWFIVKVAEFAGGSFGLSHDYCHDYSSTCYFAAYD